MKIPFQMRRRTFLQSAAGVALASPLGAASQPNIRLGIDAYSIRSFGWKAAQIIDYAKALKVDAVMLSSPDAFQGLEPAQLTKLRADADSSGILIETAIGSICPTSSAYGQKNGDPAEFTLKQLRVAKAVGARVMRCFLGGSADRQGPRPFEVHMQAMIKVLGSVRSQALDLGVKIAIENHGDFQARELRSVIEQAGKDWVGVCLDNGNPLTVVEDPMLTIEVLGPYTFTAHVRDSVVYEHPRGAAMQYVALGDGTQDLRAYVARFRELCPTAAFNLEVITGRTPTILPYLEPDFWKAFPNANAAEFARFVALAKKGRPFEGKMVIAEGGNMPPEFQAAMKAQQRYDLERSLTYAAKVLGIGIRGRA